MKRSELKKIIREVISEQMRRKSLKPNRMKGMGPKPLRPAAGKEKMTKVLPDLPGINYCYSPYPSQEIPCEDCINPQLIHQGIGIYQNQNIFNCS